MVASLASTTFDIWSQLHLLFHDNQAGRAVILGAEFRNLVQGDLSIAEYCRRLKSLATELGDVGEHITDRTLTLQLIRGLSRKFQIMATLIPMQSPFLSFVQARSRLLMEEILANERARLDGRPEVTVTALTIGSGSGSSGSSTDHGVDRSANDKCKGTAASPTADRDNGGRDRGRGAAAPTSGPQLTGYFAPYGALIPNPSQPRPAWAAPNAADVLGPHRHTRPTRCAPRRRRAARRGSSTTICTPPSRTSPCSTTRAAGMSGFLIPAPPPM